MLYYYYYYAEHWCWCCFVGCASDNQLHILYGGVLGADIWRHPWMRSPAYVVDAAAAEDGYWAWRRQLISVVRPAAAAYGQRWSHEAGGGSPCSRVLHALPSWTARERLCVQPSQTVSIQSVEIQQCPPQSRRLGQSHWRALIDDVAVVCFWTLVMKRPQCTQFRLSSRAC